MLERMLKVWHRCKLYQLANLFPARAVALACVQVVLEGRGLSVAEDTKQWVRNVSSGRVDLEDLEEAVEGLRNG